MKTLARAACVGLLLSGGVAAAAYARAHRRPTRARVPLGSVTGRAAAAVGDSGIFASPVLPLGAHPVIPHADAESAGVAMGYWEAPVDKEVFRRTAHNVPTERRHFCGRSYYVLPVVAMPDTTVVITNTSNDWMTWTPTWVMPICDDKEAVRSSVELGDVPTGLHVIQGSSARDVPELVPDSGTWPHIAYLPTSQIRDLERGIGITPETAVAVAHVALGKTGARVAEVPEAFMKVRQLDPSPGMPRPRVVGEIATCPRWRLTLDRPVTLHGASSGQSVSTSTVYVGSNGRGDCEGDPVLQIPQPGQPSIIPFMYIAGMPKPNTRIMRMPAPDVRWTSLRVLEPLWFEEARVERH